MHALHPVWHSRLASITRTKLSIVSLWPAAIQGHSMAACEIDGMGLTAQEVSEIRQQERNQRLESEHCQRSRDQAQLRCSDIRYKKHLSHAKVDCVQCR